MSVYNAQTGQWQQTWVDNQGSYLDFVGGVVGDKMILSRLAVISDEPVLQRMVWADMEQDSLNWTWERSSDDADSFGQGRFGALVYANLPVLAPAN